VVRWLIGAVRSIGPQEPGEGEPFGVGEGRLDGNEGSGWGSSGIGHLPAGLRPRRLGQWRVPAIERKPNVSSSSRSLHVTDTGTWSEVNRQEALQTADRPEHPGLR